MGDKSRASIEHLAKNYRNYRIVAVSGDLVPEVKSTAAVQENAP